MISKIKRRFTTHFKLFKLQNLCLHILHSFLQVRFYMYIVLSDVVRIVFKNNENFHY